MIQVSLKKENGSIVFFEVSGHSGYAEEGSDIVCASVSSIVWSTVNGLETLLHINCDVTEREALVSVKIPVLSKEKRKEADILLQSMDLFLDEIIRQYGIYITKTEV